MATKDIQQQIDEINQKLDIILECAVQQKLRSQKMDDLLADLSVVGKDAFKDMVAELDTQGIELNVEDIKYLIFKLIKNIDKISSVITTLESAYDLMQDMGPVVREVIIDFIRKLHTLEQKGYFEFIRELSAMIDNIVTHYTAEDARLLSNNIVPVLDTIKNITQPGVLKAINNTVSVYQKMEAEYIPEYSVWKAMREMQSPEMKRSIGFLITFMKNISHIKQQSITV